MKGTLWEHIDPDGDRACLDTRTGADTPPGTIALLSVDASSAVWLDREAAETLREALDRLLDVDEQAPSSVLIEAAAISDRAVIVSETVTEHNDVSHVAGSVETLANDLANLARLVGRIGGAS